MFRRLIGLIKKEFIQFYRDYVSMLIILYFFTICIILCGYNYIFDVKDLDTVVLDMNKTAKSRDLVERFTSNEYFRFESFASTLEDVESKIISGRADVGLIIPPEFTRNLSSNKSASLQFIVDGTDVIQAGQGIGFAKRIIGTYNQEILVKRLNSAGVAITHPPGIINHLRTFFNQEMEGIYYVVIYHVVIGALMGSLILSSAALVREKERGTIDQLLVTPVHSWELLLAKVIAPFIIAMIATIFSFYTIIWFDVPCRGNVFTFFAFMAFFLIGMTGIGILLGTICQNMIQAILMAFAVWFSLIAMAGILAPLDNLPPVLYKVALYLPTTNFIIAASGIFQKGIGFEILWPQAVTLVGMGLVFLSIGSFIAWRQWKQ
ncbi:MAG: ABC transporter permease [Spirochaetota bacterium]|nr:ABC transporter permease [Spirochaetota bacterium]